MWYVIQVQTGKEEEIIHLIRRYRADGYFEDCFIPKYQSKRRYRGEWHLVNAPLFPGYVFIISNEIEQFYFLLRQLPEFIKLLGTGEKWTPLSEEEVRILQSLTDQSHLMRLSQGCIVGDQVVITDGPLKGMEGCIRKINRHKRVAKVELLMLGQMRQIEVGLEIVRKDT